MTASATARTTIGARLFRSLISIADPYGMDTPGDDQMELCPPFEGWNIDTNGIIHTPCSRPLIRGLVPYNEDHRALNRGRIPP